MAEKIVSPGVFTRENDLTFLAQGVSSIGATIIAPFNEGPTTPTVVSSLADLETYYGKADDNYYGPLAAKFYLQEAGQVTICRVTGTTGYVEKNPLLLVYATGSGVQKALGVLFNTDDDANSFTTGLAINGNYQTTAYNGLNVISASVTAASSTDWGFGLSGSNFGPSVSASLYAGAASNIKFAFGTAPRGVKEAYSYAFFGGSAQSGLFVTAGTAAVSGAILFSQSFSVAAQPAFTPVIQSQLTGGDRTNLLKFYTRGAGEPTNTKVKVSIYNIKPSGIINGSDYGTFSVLVRAFSDTDKKKESYESYSNVTLDPLSPNYVLRVIGNRSKTIATNGNVTEYGDFPNFSKYIRCWNEGDTDWVDPTSINATSVPYAHAPYKLMISASNSYWTSLIPAVTYASASSTVFGGIDLDNNTDNANYMRAIPLGASSGSNIAFSLDTLCGLPLTGSLQTDVNKRRFTVAFQGGFNGVNPTTTINKGTDISATNTQGFDVSSTTKDGYTAYLTQINALSNADEYDTNLVVTPGLIRNVHSTLVDKVLEMVENRGDCFFIMDAVGFSGTIEDVNAQAQEVDSNYAAIYYPWVKAVNTTTNKLMAVPPSVLLPAVYAASDRITAEWYAPAGLNRGGLTNAVAVVTKLNQNDRDNLYESKVNPIAQFPGQGIVAFGQKTLQDKSSALDRINVRRLLLTVRKFISSATRYLVFEQNTAETRQKFVNIVQPYLEGIQQRQGLYAFKVQMDEALNTPDMIDRGILKGAIFLQPTRTAEFIVVDFNILPTGASFGS